jgi:outer membrane receptor protein involved in Fe transport
VRYQGKRPFDRDNVAFDEAFTEWDAGAWWEWKEFRLSVTGRNLGDSRHVVGESDIGDALLYIAPPRRVTAELTCHLPMPGGGH